jgi:hypothetical protein
MLDRGHYGGKSLHVRSVSNSNRVFSSLAAVAQGHFRIKCSAPQKLMLEAAQCRASAGGGAIHKISGIINFAEMV